MVFVMSHCLILDGIHFYTSKFTTHHYTHFYYDFVLICSYSLIKNLPIYELVIKIFVDYIDIFHCFCNTILMLEVSFSLSFLKFETSNKRVLRHWISISTVTSNDANSCVVLWLKIKPDTSKQLSYVMNWNCTLMAWILQMNLNKIWCNWLFHNILKSDDIYIYI